MRNFRHIQPATQARPHAASDDASAASHQPPGKRQQVAQACEECRRQKIRCGGERPKCGTCVTKNRLCVYEQTKSTKSRLESLEKVLAALRTGSQEQADQLVRRIRNAAPVAELVSALASPEDSDQRNSPSAADGVQKPDPQRPVARVQGSRPPPSASSDASSITPTATSCSSEQGERDHEAGQNPISTDGRPREVLMPDVPLSPKGLPLLDIPLIQQAIQSFFSCSGKLFHVFSPEEVAQVLAIASNPELGSAEDKNVAIGTVTAVAAVGAQYLPDQCSLEAAGRFYDIARHYFEIIVEEQPLYAIRVCTLLVQYNIMDKALVSLAYLEIGLGMGRLYGLSTEATFQHSLPQSERVTLRRTWRTLLFFSSWLASTLGYISGNDILSKSVNVSTVMAENTTDISDVVQTEMMRICLLKANILRMQLSFKEFTLPAMKSIMVDLRAWYAQLPGALRLETSGQENLLPEMRRSILHVHLLYLGALMLLYRRIVSQFVEYYQAGVHSSISQTPLHDVVVEYSCDVALAASTSARIVKLLLENNGIFKRCWLVIFQTYTACLVLLHVAAQKKVHQLEASTWEAEKMYTRDCLRVLQFCGSTDRVAARFYTQLTEIFEKLFHEPFQSTLPGNRQDVEVQPHPLAGSTKEKESTTQYLLLNIPDAADPSHLHLSMTIMALLSQPFGKSPDKHAIDKAHTDYWTIDTIQTERHEVEEHREWNSELSTMFERITTSSIQHQYGRSDI